MAKKRAADAVPPKNAYKPRGRAFQATQAQRAFVAAAAGLKVPSRVICQMMPGARAGEIAPIDAHTLRNYFWRELQDGLKLVKALVEARVYERALSRDDRSAHSAQALILNAGGGWKSADDPSLREPAEPPLAMHRLSREERDMLRKLLAKATELEGTEDSETGAAAADGDSRRRKRRHGKLS
jgi:hypothetical protein